jgi:hypothetical protein
MFKSYRYHPNFAQEVPGGFLSPTFSHQIDAEKPFCPYETTGGVCTIADCPNQHFQGIGITGALRDDSIWCLFGPPLYADWLSFPTGEALLVQLGTANPGKTPADRQQWNDGLRRVLQELRKKSIKDPNGIAAEIAKFRRQFLNDDSRVVNLWGV